MPLAITILVFLSVYLIVNFWRVAVGRIQPEYLKHASAKTLNWLIGMQLLVILIGFAVIRGGLNTNTGFYFIVWGQLVVATILLLSTLRNVRAARVTVPVDTIPDKDLPSLSICIPARNETEDLEECLKSLVASDYPKLEIIVLDDCSQDKRTPEIIRKFAQDGIRFIAGTIPNESWLAKNHAYSQLAGQANGELLLFCGVDCRFEPDTLSKVINTMRQKQSLMLSIMPRNILTKTWNLKHMVIQANRYAWELLLPRNFTNRPPVLSTCWVIQKPILEAAGGFAAVSRKCVPEAYFARFASKSSPGYKFVIASSSVGLVSIKNHQAQRDTAIRTRYPQLHRRPELVALVSLAEIALLIWPFIIFLVSLAKDNIYLAVLSGFTSAIILAIYSMVVNVTYRRFVPFGLIIAPLAAIYDVVLLNFSMWSYEFSQVIWKGRNVCLPVMRAIPSLPNTEGSDEIRYGNNKS